MSLGDTILLHGFNFIAAALIFIIGKRVARWITNLFIKSLRKSKNSDATLERFLDSAVNGLLLLIVVLAALGTLGVDTTSFIAVLGAVGLAIGLAFQNTLANISSGVMIIIFKPIKVGEVVDAGGATGAVEEINIFNTILKTPDNKTIIIGNAGIIGGNIVNYSREKTRRVDLTFGISYDDDLKLAKDVLLEVINADERVLKDPAPFVAVSELADSSVNFVTRSWVKTEDYWGVYFDTLEKVKLTFDEKNISMPYPQMDVHIEK